MILFGFTVSAYYRPAGGTGSPKDGSFLLRIVLPVTAGTVLLTAAAGSWIDHLTGSWAEFKRWAVLGALIYVFARLAAGGLRFVAGAAGAKSRPDRREASRFIRKKPRHVAFELLCWAAAGLLTGALVGLGAWLCFEAVLPPLGLLEHTAEQQRQAARILAVAGPPWILSSFLAGEVLYTGFASRLPYGDEDREWLARAAGWFGAIAVGYFAFTWLVLFGWDYLEATIPYFHRPCSR